MNTALTILNQLGGNKFVYMTGVKNLVSCEEALMMDLPKNNSEAKYLRIEIEGNDTYNLIFRKQNKKDFTFPIVKIYKNVFAQSLNTIFEIETGLITKI